MINIDWKVPFITFRVTLTNKKKTNAGLSHNLLGKGKKTLITQIVTEVTNSILCNQTLLVYSEVLIGLVYYFCPRFQAYMWTFTAVRLKSACVFLLWWNDLRAETRCLPNITSLQCQTRSSWWSSCWLRPRPYWSFWGCRLHSGSECWQLWGAENTHSTKGYSPSGLNSIRYKKGM